MRVEARGDTPQRLRRLARREANGRVAVRILAVASAMEGKTAPQVARELGVARRTVQDWVRWYNDGGVGELRDAGGRGRKPPLNAEERERLKARLDAGPRPGDADGGGDGGGDGGVCTLSGRDVQRILREEFGKVRCLSSVYEVLHGIGYSHLMPRPRHPEGASAAEQDAFKKTRPG